MAALRQVKTEEELVLLKAVEISAIGQIEVMKAIKPSMSELEIQGIMNTCTKNTAVNMKAITQ